jgi:hypothetical protein
MPTMRVWRDREQRCVTGLAAVAQLFGSVAASTRSKDRFNHSSNARSNASNRTNSGWTCPLTMSMMSMILPSLPFSPRAPFRELL